MVCECRFDCPSPPNALKQMGTFHWCARTDVAFADGFVEVKLKPLSGNEDLAGGVVWRWTSDKSYYVASMSALENNITFYYVERGGGKRTQVCQRKNSSRCLANAPRGV